MSEDKQQEKILLELEQLKEHSILVFAAAHRLTNQILRQPADSVQGDGEAVVLEFQRFLKKSDK